MPSTAFIHGPHNYPHGWFEPDPKAKCSEGDPTPKLDPACGTLFMPEKDAKKQQKLYGAYAEKLMGHMDAKIPRTARNYIQLKRPLKLPTDSDTYWLAMAYQLSWTSFILCEYVDAFHPLLKIATAPNFKEFKKAIDQLPDIQ